MVGLVLLGLARFAARKTVRKDLIKDLIGNPLRAAVRQIDRKLLQPRRREAVKALRGKPALPVGPQQLEAIAPTRLAAGQINLAAPRDDARPRLLGRRCIGSESSSLSSSARSVTRCGSSSPLTHRVIKSRPCCSLIKGATGRCHAFNIVIPLCTEWAHLATALRGMTHHRQNYWGRRAEEDIGKAPIDCRIARAYPAGERPA